MSQGTSAMTYGRVSLLWPAALAALLVGGVVQADEVTATITMSHEALHGWIDRACDWFHVCTEGTDAERAQQVATHFSGEVVIRACETDHGSCDYEDIETK